MQESRNPAQRWIASTEAKSARTLIYDPFMLAFSPSETVFLSHLLKFEREAGGAGAWFACPNRTFCPGWKAPTLLRHFDKLEERGAIETERRGSHGIRWVRLKDDVIERLLKEGERRKDADRHCAS